MYLTITIPNIPIFHLISLSSTILPSPCSSVTCAYKTAIGRGHYLLLLIDDTTRHTDQYILKNKSEALQRFQEWKALRERESGLLVKRLQTDGGGEYTSTRFATYLWEEGIMRETTTPYTPQSNGVVERANRTVMDRVQCMLEDAGLSHKY